MDYSGTVGKAPRCHATYPSFSSRVERRWREEREEVVSRGESGMEVVGAGILKYRSFLG